MVMSGYCLHFSGASTRHWKHDAPVLCNYIVGNLQSGTLLIMFPGWQYGFTISVYTNNAIGRLNACAAFLFFNFIRLNCKYLILL